MTNLVSGLLANMHATAFSIRPFALGRYLARPSLSTCAYNRNLCTLVNSAEVSGCSAHERKVQVERLPHQHDTRQAWSDLRQEDVKTQIGHTCSSAAVISLLS